MALAFRLRNYALILVLSMLGMSLPAQAHQAPVAKLTPSDAPTVPAHR